MAAPIIVNQPGVYLVDEDGNTCTLNDAGTIGTAEGIVIMGKDGTIARMMVVDATGKLAIQDQPNMDVALSTLASETKLEAVRVLLATIDADTSILAAVDYATQTTLATLATEAKLEAVRVILASLDAKDFATQTTLATIAAAVAVHNTAEPTSGVAVAGTDDLNKLQQIAAIDDGTHKRLAVDSVGSSTVDIGAGLVGGSRLFGGFGERNSLGVTVSGEDIWTGVATAQPTPADAGESMTVVSTSADDTSAGIGTRTLEVHYLDASGNEQLELVTMNGTTPIALVATNIRFVQFIHSGTVGTNGVAVGIITIYKTGAATTVYNIIQAGGNMSLTSARMIPLGKKCVVTNWHATESKAKKIAFRLRSTDSDGLLLPGVFVFKDAMYLTSSALQASTGFVAPALSIVKVSGWAPVSGAEAAASWDGVLVNE